MNLLGARSRTFLFICRCPPKSLTARSFGKRMGQWGNYSWLSFRSQGLITGRRSLELWSGRLYLPPWLLDSFSGFWPPWCEQPSSLFYGLWFCWLCKDWNLWNVSQNKVLFHYVMHVKCHVLAMRKWLRPFVNYLLDLQNFFIWFYPICTILHAKFFLNNQLLCCHHQQSTCMVTICVGAFLSIWLVILH